PKRVGRADSRRRRCRRRPGATADVRLEHRGQLDRGPIGIKSQRQLQERSVRELLKPVSGYHVCTCGDDYAVVRSRAGLTPTAVSAGGEEDERGIPRGALFVTIASSR